MTGLPLNIDVQQILLHAFNLCILLGGLYIILYKPVKDFMDKRVKYYEDMASNADRVLAESEEKKKLYEEKLKAADSEIEELKAEAMEKSRKASEKELETAREDAAKIRESAKALAESERAKIIADAKKEVVNLAADAAAKIVAGEDEYSSFLASVE